LPAKTILRITDESIFRTQSHMVDVVMYNLATAVHRYSLETPDALALASQGVELSYVDLASRASALAAQLKSSPAWQQQDGQLPRVAILASRSIEACLASLGASWAGATLVPISLKVPEERLISLLSRHRFCALIADTQGAELLTDRVASVCPPLVILPNSERQVALASMADLELCNLHDLPETATQDGPVPVKATDLAYIIFTSGTTGEPKGVMISCGAFRNYIEKITENLGLCSSDRALAVCELSFDPSLHDMFANWQVGASLHVLPANRVMNAVKFARGSKLTIWHSVPSLAGMLKQIKVLSPGVMPDLRLTIFGGEQLPLSTIEIWQSAAPNSAIVNGYGPTEVTVACLNHRIEPSAPLSFTRATVPIGSCISGTEAAILRDDRTFAGIEEPGELILFGVQLAEGYLASPELTAAKFPTIDGRRCYLTGDLVVRDSTGIYYHLGRIDNQVKVLGHRVELEDVDTHVRVASGSELVATVAWPIVDGAAQGLVAFIGASSVDQGDVIAKLKSRLPAYMVPNSIVAIEDIPLNSSSKVDRGALLESLRRKVVDEL
jgi:D-alanine--poly(phosphoribitol) ligase subunit 1